MNRLHVIQSLIDEFGYQSYLEIGCGDNTVFSRIKRITEKVGVDPIEGGTVRNSSDYYFELLTPSVRFDIIFIDGLHEHEQVLRDIDNSLYHLNEHGVIVVHDCLPTNEDEQLSIPQFYDKFEKQPPSDRYWTGDIWKAIAELKTLEYPDLVVLDQDWGMGIIKGRANQSRLPSYNAHSLEWLDFNQLKHHFPLVHTVAEVLEFASQGGDHDRAIAG